MTESKESSAPQIEARRVVVSELHTRPGGGKLLERPQEVIRDVKVQVSVLIGNAELSIAQLFDIRDGEVVALNHRIDEPLDLLIDGKVIARGELVVAENSLGLRITEVAPR